MVLSEWSVVLVRDVFDRPGSSPPLHPFAYWLEEVGEVGDLDGI